MEFNSRQYTECVYSYNCCVGNLAESVLISRVKRKTTGWFYALLFDCQDIQLILIINVKFALYSDLVCFAIPDSLENYFKQYGAIKESVIMRDPVTRRSR